MMTKIMIWNTFKQNVFQKITEKNYNLNYKLYLRLDENAKTVDFMNLRYDKLFKSEICNLNNLKSEVDCHTYIYIDLYEILLHNNFVLFKEQLKEILLYNYPIILCSPPILSHKGLTLDIVQENKNYIDLFLKLRKIIEDIVNYAHNDVFIIQSPPVADTFLNLINKNKLQCKEYFGIKFIPSIIFKNTNLFIDKDIYVNNIFNVLNHKHSMISEAKKIILYNQNNEEVKVLQKSFFYKFCSWDFYINRNLQLKPIYTEFIKEANYSFTANFLYLCAVLTVNKEYLLTDLILHYR